MIKCRWICSICKPKYILRDRNLLICKTEYDFIGQVLGSYVYQVLIHAGLKLTQRIFKKCRCVNDCVSPIKWNSAEQFLQNLQKEELQHYVTTEQETETDIKFRWNSSWEWTKKNNKGEKLPQTNIIVWTKVDRNKLDDEDQSAPHELPLGETKYSK